MLYICVASLSMKSCMILSSLATTSIKEVAEANGSGLRWFQFHIFRDKAFTIDLVQQAERAGYKALVLTIDIPAMGRQLEISSTCLTE